MRAVVVEQPGSAEVLQVKDVPDPVPAAGEVLVRVAAAGVNRADLLQRQGHYPPPAGASPYLGMELSGTVEALGPDVAGWRVGDEVCALVTGGGYAELAVVPVGQLMPVPRGIALVDAAALPEAACTVWSMVFSAGHLQPGESLLVHGGSSGIGTMAIQLAHARGSRVFTTVGTPRKANFCTELGADVAINYREEQFEERILADTGGAGVDVVLDIMGASYLGRNVLSLAFGGRLIVIGLQGGRTGELDLGFLLAKRLTLHAATLRARSLEQKAVIVAETQHAVWPLIEAGEVRPVIDRVLTLDDATEAHRLVESSEHIGKVLLRTE